MKGCKRKLGACQDAEGTGMVAGRRVEVLWSQVTMAGGNRSCCERPHQVWPESHK